LYMWNGENTFGFLIPFSCEKGENTLRCHYPFTPGWHISLLDKARFEVIEVYVM